MLDSAMQPGAHGIGISRVLRRGSRSFGSTPLALVLEVWAARVTKERLVASREALAFIRQGHEVEALGTSKYLAIAWLLLHGATSGSTSNLRSRVPGLVIEAEVPIVVELRTIAGRSLILVTSRAAKVPVVVELGCLLADISLKNSCVLPLPAQLP